MGMVWPWKHRLQRLSSSSQLGLRWLALLERDHSTATDRDSHHSDTHAVSDTNTVAFEAFFLRFDRQITSYLWRMTGDEQIASELAQETFLRAWQHFDVVCRYEQPLSWLFHVATNLARQHHRRQGTPVRTATALDAENDPVGSGPALHFAEQDLVRQTLLQLPIHQRAALILREVHGFSCAEVGALLNMSRDAVKMALWRAREQFRVLYLREEEDK